MTDSVAPSPPQPSSRYYTTNLDAHYILPSDDEERVRLKLQYDVINAEFNNVLLPPSMPFEAGDLVLDAGTGSGLWALDISSQVPEGVRILACDVEQKLFPVTAPSNVTFEVHSVLSLPALWASSFKLIHQRLMVTALSLPEWGQAFLEYHRVLKPGGILLFEELGRPVLPHGNAEYQDLLPATYRMWNVIMTVTFAFRNLDLSCFTKIPGLLEEAGFCILRNETVRIPLGPGDHGKNGRTNWIEGFRGVKKFVLQVPGSGVRSEEEFERLLDATEEEWSQNPIWMEFHGFTAVKEV